MHNNHQLEYFDQGLSQIYFIIVVFFKLAPAKVVIKNIHINHTFMLVTVKYMFQHFKQETVKPGVYLRVMMRLLYTYTLMYVLKTDINLQS